MSYFPGRVTLCGCVVSDHLHHQMFVNRHNEFCLLLADQQSFCVSQRWFATPENLTPPDPHSAPDPRPCRTPPWRTSGPWGRRPERRWQIPALGAPSAPQAPNPSLPSFHAPKLLCPLRFLWVRVVGKGNTSVCFVPAARLDVTQTFRLFAFERMGSSREALRRPIRTI